MNGTTALRAFPCIVPSDGNFSNAKHMVGTATGNRVMHWLAIEQCAKAHCSAMIFASLRFAVIITALACNRKRNMKPSQGKHMVDTATGNRVMYWLATELCAKAHSSVMIFASL